MSRLHNYIFRTAFGAFVAALCSLVGIIWITQSLRQIDLLTSKGQTLLVFLSLTSLLIPSLIVIIGPVALFIAVLYTLNKLNGDSEWIVMSAAGVPPHRLLFPFLNVTLLATAFVAWMSLSLMPWSFHAIEDMTSKIRSDFLTRVLREGQFTTLVPGFVFHYREKAANGALLGVFMQDRRDSDKISSYIAEKGLVAQSDNGHSYLVLDKGSLQRQAQGSDATVVQFDRYAIDLNQFNQENDTTIVRPRERTTDQLMALDLNDPTLTRYAGRFRAELQDRFVSPIYALVACLIGFAALGQARTTRQGRGLAILTAILLFSALRFGGISASNLYVSNPSAFYIIWGLPLTAIVLTGLESLGVLPDLGEIFIPFGQAIAWLVASIIRIMPFMKLKGKNSA